MSGEYFLTDKVKDDMKNKKKREEKIAQKQLKLEEAKQAYEQVIALDANNKTARKRLKLLDRKAGLNRAA